MAGGPPLGGAPEPQSGGQSLLCWPPQGRTAGWTSSLTPSTLSLVGPLRFSYEKPPRTAFQMSYSQGCEYSCLNNSH